MSFFQPGVMRIWWHCGHGMLGVHDLPIKLCWEFENIDEPRRNLLIDVVSNWIVRYDGDMAGELRALEAAIQQAWLNSPQKRHQFRSLTDTDNLVIWTLNIVRLSGPLALRAKDRRIVRRRRKFGWTDASTVGTTSRDVVAGRMS